MKNVRWHLAIMVAICALFAWLGARGGPPPQHELTAEERALGWLPRDVKVVTVVRPQLISQFAGNETRQARGLAYFAGDYAPLLESHLPLDAADVVCGSVTAGGAGEDQCAIILASGREVLPTIAWRYTFSGLPENQAATEFDRTILRRDTSGIADVSGAVVILSTRQSLLDEMAARSARNESAAPPNGLRPVVDEKAIAWGRCRWGRWALHADPDGCVLKLAGTPEFVGWSTRMLTTPGLASKDIRITRSDPEHADAHMPLDSKARRSVHWWLQIMLTCGQSFGSDLYEPVTQP